MGDEKRATLRSGLFLFWNYLFIFFSFHLIYSGLFFYLLRDREDTQQQVNKPKFLRLIFSFSRSHSPTHVQAHAHTHTHTPTHRHTFVTLFIFIFYVSNLLWLDTLASISENSEMDPRAQLSWGPEAGDTETLGGRGCGAEGGGHTRHPRKENNSTRLPEGKPKCFPVVCLNSLPSTSPSHQTLSPSSSSFSLFLFFLLSFCFWTVTYGNVTGLLGWMKSGYAKPNVTPPLPLHPPFSLLLYPSGSVALCSPQCSVGGRRGGQKGVEHYSEGTLPCPPSPTPPHFSHLDWLLLCFFLSSLFSPLPSFTTLCECCLPSSQQVNYYSLGCYLHSQPCSDCC